MTVRHNNIINIIVNYYKIFIIYETTIQARSLNLEEKAE